MYKETCNELCKFNNDLFKYNRKKLTQADILRNNPTFVDAARRTNK